MPIGQKMGSIKKLKASLKKGSMGPIRYIPKNGSLTVRFLEEPENWVNYNEHWDAMRKVSYPCIEGNGVCPGCASDERKTSRYLANALNVEDDRVIAIQLPKDLTNRLVAKYERTDTMMDRDYTLTRDGEGLDTTYDYDAEPPLNRKLTKYTLLDLEDVLDDVVQRVLGVDDDDEDDEPAKPVQKKTPTRKKSAAAQAVQAKHRARVEEDEDDEDDEPAPKARKFKAPPARAEVDEDDDEELEDDEDEDEDEDIDVDDEDEDDEDVDDEDIDTETPITEEELQGMSIGEVRAIAKEVGHDVSGMKKQEIIDLLMEGADEDEDDEPDEDEEPF